MSDWDAMRQRNADYQARGRFDWTPQRRGILRAEAYRIRTGDRQFVMGVSNEWYARQLSRMRKHYQVATNEQLVAIARSEGIIDDD